MKQLAKEYAQALFALCCEDGIEDAADRALSEVSAQIVAQPAYMELLASPAIPLSERRRALETVFAQTVPGPVLSFLLLLCDKGRIRLLPACTEEYRALLNLKRAVAVARVTSAAPLTDAEKTALMKKLQDMSKKTVTLVCSVDPSLLGGAVVEMDGKVIDGSLRHKLQKVKEVISR